MRFLTVLICSGVLWAQGLKLAPDLMPIVEMAYGAPPEFAADALLRVVESGKVTDKPTRRQLIKDAFNLGASAQLKAPMRAATGVGPDSRAGSLDKAYRLKLDTVSIQSRAVNAMLGLDKPAARELFGAISKAAPEALNCESPLTYDFSDYYRTLGAVVQSTFTPAERHNDDHVQFLLNYAGQARSPSELQALTGILPGAGLTPDQLQAVQARVRSAAPESSGTGCKDTKPVTEGYWRSEATTRMVEAVTALRLKNGAVLSEADRASHEWQEQLTDVLKTLGDWSAGQEKSEADYFNQKCMVYEALVELAPPGPERDKLLAAFVSFLGSSSLQSQSPAEWFVHAKGMLDRLRNTNAGEPARVLAAYEASGNPALGVYAALERTFESPRPAWAASAAR